MKQVSSQDARRRFRDLLDDAQIGETAEISRNGKVIAILVPAGRYRLDEIAELLPEPCSEPGIADGYDLCSCGSGEVWPCNLTRAAWLAAGRDPRAEMRKVLDAVKAEQAAEMAEWEALNETDPDAARRYAARKLGW